MKRMETLLFSEIGMKLVNTLFFLSAFIRNRGIIFVAYIVWVVYLLYCIKITQSKTMKRLYVTFILYAAIILLLNVYFYWKLL